jgi:uncharacterized repeat protein (TIGR02543 family)
MKNFAKLFVIAAISAVIGFSMFACGGGGGGGPGNRNSPVDPNPIIPGNPGGDNPGGTIGGEEPVPSTHWSITWYLNGGFIFDSQKGYYPTQIEKGKVLKNPFDYDDINPAQSSYTFEKWYADPNLSVPYDFSKPVNADLNLYAGWFLGQTQGEIVPGASLKAKLDYVTNMAQGEKTKTYVIYVDEDEAIDPYTPLRFGPSIDKNITVILYGRNGEKVVSLKSNGAMFTVGNCYTLVLDRNITLKGRDNNNNTMIDVESDGKLEMRFGSKITGNNNSGENGGAVNALGTFTMNGGKISGNTSRSRAGGVRVGGGSFTMNGGEISGNIAKADSINSGGGGVYLTLFNSSFTMNGGVISGNVAEGHDGGGGVMVGYVANLGNYKTTFTMNGGEISGNEALGIMLTDNDGGRNYVGISGGGVLVCSPHEFIMNGGRISGNKAIGSGKSTGNSDAIAYGGGVAVRASGSFIMNGGEIFGNTAQPYGTAKSYGGGVYIQSYTSMPSGTHITAKFRMVNGTIYGSNASASLRNTAKSNAALVASTENPSAAMGFAVADSEYGTFSGTTWIKKGDLGSSDNTIRVVNGVLQ